MGNWKFNAVGLSDRPIRQEEVYLMCQLLPPSVLALITRDDVELDVERLDTHPTAGNSQLIANEGDTA